MITASRASAQDLTRQLGVRPERLTVIAYAPDPIFRPQSPEQVAQVRARYQQRYPTPAAMGRLTFSDLEIHPIGADHAYVIGRWNLERPKEAGGDTGGIYTLLFRKTSKGWKIILDHTT